MKINIHHTFLPHTNAEESLAFYRDVLGFEVQQDVGHGEMRWITAAPAGGGPSIVLTPPAVDPGLSDEERSVINGLIAKGAYATIILSTDDLDGLFTRIEGSTADVIQEPMAQDWGVRDFAFSDPAGNTVRVQQQPQQ